MPPMQADEIEARVKSTLDSLARTADSREWRSDVLRTPMVMKALLPLADDFGAMGCAVGYPGSGGTGFLYDMSWYTFELKPGKTSQYLRRLPLVLECEWMPDQHHSSGSDQPT